MLCSMKQIHDDKIISVRWLKYVWGLVRGEKYVQSCSQAFSRFEEFYTVVHGPGGRKFCSEFHYPMLLFNMNYPPPRMCMRPDPRVHDSKDS